MPLFKVGNFDQVGVSFAQKAKFFNVKNKAEVAFPQTLPLSAVSELSFNIEIPSMGLATSEKSWGLFLRKIYLKKSFEGFLVNMFNPNNEIYFTSIAWDYSGKIPFVYPSREVAANTAKFLINLKENECREFLGDGINIWPTQKVVGALNLVILVYECDDDVKKLGARLDSIHEIVKKSGLTKLITAISADPALATGVAIGMAVNELLGGIGKMMQKNQDDDVDLFEGSWGTHKPQTPRIEKYDHEASSIELEFVVT